MYETPKQIYGIYVTEYRNGGAISWIDYMFWYKLKDAQKALAKFVEGYASSEFAIPGSGYEYLNNECAVVYVNGEKRFEYRIMHFGIL